MTLEVVIHEAERGDYWARYFKTSPQFWLGLQADYDLDVATLSLGNRLDWRVKADGDGFRNAWHQLTRSDN